MSYASECCGAEPHGTFHFDGELGICGDCCEHAYFEEYEPDYDAEQEHWKKHAAWAERFMGD